MYRDISNFREGYQPRNNVVKDEKGNMAADIHSILAKWRKHFCQILNVHGVIDGRQPEIQQTLLVPGASAFLAEMAFEKLKKHMSPGIDQIPVDLIMTGG